MRVDNSDVIVVCNHCNRELTIHWATRYATTSSNIARVNLHVTPCKCGSYDKGYCDAMREKNE